MTPATRAGIDRNGTVATVSVASVSKTHHFSVTPDHFLKEVSLVLLSSFPTTGTHTVANIAQNTGSQRKAVERSMKAVAPDITSVSMNSQVVTIRNDDCRRRANSMDAARHRIAGVQA